MKWLAWRRCKYGHDWFPDRDEVPREFIPVQQVCLRCTTARAILPWGQCLSGHPIAEHYDTQGELIPHPTCVGPR